MEMKLQSQNLHQHVMNTLYSDKSGCDTVLRVGQASYLCHAAILASSSSLLHSALLDPQVHLLHRPRPYSDCDPDHITRLITSTSW